MSLKKAVMKQNGGFSNMEIRILMPGVKQPSFSDGALLLGNFDGVHRGHQTLVFAARNVESHVGVLLFQGNPTDFFPSHKSSKILTTWEDKVRLFASFGVEYAYLLPLDASLFQESKEEFMEKVLRPLNPGYLVVGTDYTFGRHAEGKVEDLKKEFSVLALPLLSEDGKKIATWTIIEEIEEGNISKANEDLGHDYQIRGQVIEGFHNGRKIGYPTANLCLSDPYVLPKSGVYAGWTEVDGVSYPSMINVGSNPTVGNLHHPIIETHLIDFTGDLYGKMVAVSFRSYLRGEKKFADLSALENQLNSDLITIKKVLK